MLWVLACVLLAIYLYFRYTYTYWKRRGVPSIKPSFPLGNVGEVVFQRTSAGEMFADMYRELEGHPIGESLRKYPPASVLSRECTAPYRIPGTNVTLEKGAGVFIPVMGIHYDPAYYPEPEKFNPDRFGAASRDQQQNFTFLSFGEGPRTCIGMQFAMLQMKVAIASLVSHYSFEICDESPVPLVLDPKAILLTPLGGMKLKILPRSKENIL